MVITKQKKQKKQKELVQFVATSYLIFSIMNLQNDGVSDKFSALN